jgi:hypothetical protein
MGLFILWEEKKWKHRWYKEPDLELKHPNHWSIERSDIAADPKPT